MEFKLKDIDSNAKKTLFTNFIILILLLWQTSTIQEKFIFFIFEPLSVIPAAIFSYVVSSKKEKIAIRYSLIAKM
jgi:hypothetical protein